MRYRSWEAYGQSNLANLLFAKGLADHLKDSGDANTRKLTAVAVHPGVIKTNLWRASRLNRLASRLITSKTIPQGATTVYAVAPRPGDTGTRRCAAPTWTTAGPRCPVPPAGTQTRSCAVLCGRPPPSSCPRRWLRWRSQWWTKAYKAFHIPALIITYIAQGRNNFEGKDFFKCQRGAAWNHLLYQHPQNKNEIATHVSHGSQNCLLTTILTS
mmetsp:Transcript_26403/g.59242  ORF Transcript_26403/g.59242 Transcript_26403/m.59242 type:complete len:213 (-) Transcript_26403:1343-1981(-)